MTFPLDFGRTYLTKRTKPKGEIKWQSVPTLSTATPVMAGSRFPIRNSWLSAYRTRLLVLYALQQERPRLGLLPRRRLRCNSLLQHEEGSRCGNQAHLQVFAEIFQDSFLLRVQHSLRFLRKCLTVVEIFDRTISSKQRKEKANV